MTVRMDNDLHAESIRRALTQDLGVVEMMEMVREAEASVALDHDERMQTMSMPPEASVQDVRAIHIDDGRYVIVLEGSVPPENWHRFAEDVHKWWESGQKFYVLQFDPKRAGGMTGIRFERVADKEDGNG